MSSPHLDERPRTNALTLATLAAEDGGALLARYRRGTLPRDLRALDGKPVGRMLAVAPLATLPALARPLASFAAHPRFPWEGKSFAPRSAEEGVGINRVSLPGHRAEWFPFATRVEPSVVDGGPCIYLDYEQPENPWFIARIRDEIREIAPGMYLGPAMWKRTMTARHAPSSAQRAVHVLWFALDFRVAR
jgi:hypothetical protein